MQSEVMSEARECLPGGLWEEASRVIRDAMLGKSAYWLAVKLSSLVSLLKARLSTEEEVRDTLACILNRGEGLELLSGRAHLRGELLGLLDKPQFKALRPYRTLLEEAFRRIASIATNEESQEVAAEASQATPGGVIKVVEYHRGFHSSDYYFVIDGDRLVHISRYARAMEGRVEDSVTYLIKPGLVGDKLVVKVSSSRRGGLFCNVHIYDIRDLGLEPLERLERARREHISLLSRYRPAYLSPSEESFLWGDWSRYYVPMLEDLKSLVEWLRGILPGPFSYVGLPMLAKCQLEMGAAYPISYLIPYSVNARRQSLQALTKQLHQLWVTLTILRYLHNRGKLHVLRASFEQSPTEPLAVLECRRGSCGLWYEFDLHPLTMCGGLLWSGHASGELKEELERLYARAERVFKARGLKRFPLRPDLAILEGDRGCWEPGWIPRVLAIIELKNADYSTWQESIETQLIPYKEIFEPELLVLASLKHIPRHVKEQLVEKGIAVVDEVHPRGSGVGELLNLIEGLAG